MSRSDAAVQIGVIDVTRTAPPSAPVEGERHIVAASATGAWATQDHTIATCEDATWRFLTPKTGWCAWSAADSVLFVYDGAVWRDQRSFPTTLDGVTHIGVNTTASSPNLLSVRSNASLFNAISTADGGTGDARIQISKAASANTASVVFSDSYSGRAEFGLVGSDGFKLKVSPDGSSFVEAFNIDQTSGNLTLLRGLTLTGVIAPAQITANQNDYNPTGFSSSSVLQVSSDAARSVTGLAGGAEGRVVSLLNTGSQTITLLDESASSASANRFTLGGDLAIAAKQGVILRYDGTATRWFAMARSGGSSGTAGALVAANNLSDVVTKATARTNLGVAIGSNVQAWDADLDAVAALSTNGLVARTGAGTASSRTIAGPAAGLTVANGDGVSGNPTLALANDLSAVEGLSGTGLARRTGTDAWSVGTAVANAELASMANNTFKGNVSGSTATPSDLTATQATAALNTMIGDSGSGGTKGLVPAAGAGDALAGKFLKADGTFAVPPGTGGGGSLSDTDRQNILLNRIYESKLYGGYRRLINAFADGFKASDGINAGSSSNYSVDNVNGNVSPSVASGSLISQSAGTAIGDTTGASGLAGAFDGTTVATFASTGTSYKSTSTSGYNNTIGKDWGSGVTHTVARFKVFGTSDYGILGTGGGSTLKLQGSNDNSTWTDLYTSGTVLTAGGQTVDVSSGITSTTAYRYHRINFNGNGSNSLGFAEVQFFDPGLPGNATIITTSQTADATVSSCRVLIEYDNTAAPTLNTDLKVEVTCNGGTTWTSASLSSVGTGQAGRKVAETVDQSCTSGTSFAARITTLNNKNVPIYGTCITVH